MEENKQQNPFDEFVEHQRRAIEEAGKAVEALVPPAFKEHGKAALKEMVEGFRVLVNATLEIVKEEIDRDDAGSTTGQNKVKVEVN